MKSEYYIISAVIILFMIVNYLHYLKKYEKGKKGEKQVAKILKRCGGKVLNGLCLPLYDGITEIDHVFICKKGVVVVETKAISGAVIGDVRDKNLTHTIGRNTHSLYNPIFQNKTHVDNVLHHFRKLGFENVPIFPLVVFTDENIELRLSGKSSIVRKSGLKSYISSLPNSKCKIPVNEIYFALKKINKNNFLNLYNHNKKIKKLK